MGTTELVLEMFKLLLADHPFLAALSLTVFLVIIASLALVVLVFKGVGLMKKNTDNSGEITRIIKTISYDIAEMKEEIKENNKLTEEQGEHLQTMEVKLDATIVDVTALKTEFELVKQYGNVINIQGKQ